MARFQNVFIIDSTTLDNAEFMGAFRNMINPNAVYKLHVMSGYVEFTNGNLVSPLLVEWAYQFSMTVSPIIYIENGTDSQTDDILRIKPGNDSFLLLTGQDMLTSPAMGIELKNTSGVEVSNLSSVYLQISVTQVTD